MIGALRYEWVRLTSIRSTWWLSIGALLLAGGISFLWSLAYDDPQSIRDLGRPAVSAAVITQGGSTGFVPLLVAYVLGMLGVFTFGHEYRHGMIRATLTALPQRYNVLLAKIIVTALWAAVVSSGCLLLGAFWGYVKGGDQGFSITAYGMPRVMLGYVLYVTMFTLIGLGVAAIIRNQAGAIVFMLVVPLVLESVLRLVLVLASIFNSIEGVVRFFPFDAGGQMLIKFPINADFTGPEPLKPLPGGLVMAVFLVLVMTIATASFVKRDA
jgi:ABC-2 type transport system permease protein